MQLFFFPKSLLLIAERVISHLVAELRARSFTYPKRHTHLEKKTMQNQQATCRWPPPVGDGCLNLLLPGPPDGLGSTAKNNVREMLVSYHTEGEI